MVARRIWVGTHPRSIVVEELLLRLAQVELFGQGLGSGRVSSTVRPRTTAPQKIGRVRAAGKAGSPGVDIGGARLGVAALTAD